MLHSSTGKAERSYLGLLQQRRHRGQRPSNTVLVECRMHMPPPNPNMNLMCVWACASSMSFKARFAENSLDVVFRVTSFEISDFAMYLN
jgi:hypothetical protein